MSGTLAEAARELARELARANDFAQARELLSGVRELAKGKETVGFARKRAPSFAEKALEAATTLLDGIEERLPVERFERLELALDAVQAVADGVERAEVLEEIAKHLAPPTEEPAPHPDPPPAARGEGGGGDTADALEQLASEIVMVSGATDAPGFQSVEQAAREVQNRLMKSGGGEPSVLEALEAIAELARDAAKGEVPPTVDSRAVLSTAASSLPAAIKGDAALAAKIGVQVRQAIETKAEVRTTILPPSELPKPPTPDGRRTTLSLGGDRAILDGFVVEAREHLANAEGRLLDLERAPEDKQVVNDLFRAFHSIKGVAGLLGLAPVVKLTHALESLLDAARKGTKKIDRGSIDALLAARDALNAATDSVADALSRGAPQAEVADPEPLVSTLEGILAGSNKAPHPDPTPAARGEGAVPAPHPDPPPASRGEGETPMSMPRATLALGSQQPVHSGVRVPMERLDHLVALVGEMVISQAQVGHDLSTGDPDAPLVKETNRLGKITREVQDLSMTLRMLPIQPLFQKLQRLVRDLVRSTGKSVRLETEGEDTRLDKSVIDDLEDPLVHMVRNAIDHGIEAPEDRQKGGKPPEGVIRVSARHAGGEILIEIQDDGKGLDTQRILAKAREKGLAPQGETPPDATVFGYIFEPGLSTAAKVTELSGRGVGMDVVKKNITRLRGRIDIESEKGRGTRFSIRLPLTLAIIDGMIVRVGEERFTLPNFTIEEALQIRPGQLVTAQARGEVIKLRGALVPFIRLREVFNLAKAPEPESICVLVEAQGERVALGVDEVLGQQQIVIKPLEPPFNEVPALGGATVLGDGRVGLILDVPKLVALALHDDAQPSTAPPPPDAPRLDQPLEGTYLVCALGAEEYGIPVLAVQEIITMLPVTAIPLVPAFVKGAVNLRGHVIPVIDLRARLGMPAVAATGETCIVIVRLPRRTVGVIVDQVREVVHLRRDATDKPPRLGPRVRADFVLGVGKAGERIAFLLDTERVLEARELIQKRGHA